jgi:hypothetical protein
MAAASTAAPTPAKGPAPPASSKAQASKGASASSPVSKKRAKPDTAPASSPSSKKTATQARAPTSSSSQQVVLHSAPAVTHLPLKKVPPQGFLALRTDSGNSWGSLRNYAMDWNAADMSETTSANPQAVASVTPGTPGLVNQKMRGAFAAIAAASEAAEVRTPFLLLLAQDLLSIHLP